MRPSTAHPHWHLRAIRRLVVAMLCCGASAAALGAQVLKGSVRTLDTSLPLPSVEITVRDSIGRELGRVYSDEQGFFTLRLRERVMHLDKLLEEPPEVPAEDHGVRRDHQRLMEAFARKG